MVYVEGSPFSLPVSDTEFTYKNQRIRGFGGVSTPLLRIGRHPYEGSLTNKRKLRSKYKHADQLFGEFEKKFQIAVPKRGNVIGIGVSGFGGNPEPQVFTVVERVPGMNIESFFDESEEQRAKVLPVVDDLYSKLFTYLAVKHKRGGYYLNDLKNEQFVISPNKNGDPDKVYFVDLDPEFSFYNRRNFEAPGTQHFFTMMLTRIVFELSKAEYLLDQGELSKAREAGLAFLESLPTTIPFYNVRVGSLIKALSHPGTK